MWRASARFLFLIKLRLPAVKGDMTNMATFEINGKEYELKITYKAVKLLNGQFEGGSYELIGKSLSGDLDAFPKIVHAALLHTNENFSKKAVDEAIEDAVDNGKLSLEDVTKICNEVVTDSFFYKATVEKLIRKNPEMKEALDQLRD